MSKFIVAIDPGQSGGIAWTNGNTVEVVPMPDTEKDISDLFTDFRKKAEEKNLEIVCVLEKVHSMPGQGVASSFKFGEHYGLLKGVITTLSIPLILVTPQAWMKTLSIGTSKGLSKTEWKNKLKQEAQRLFPDKKITLKTADALLILSWARRQTTHG